jgi:hypothetical protein
VELRLEGERVRDATGARVEIRWNGGRAIKLVASGGSYLSSHDHRVHAGVGTAATVDVDVLWPGGRRQVVRGLETNRLHHIREGAGAQPER